MRIIYFLIVVAFSHLCHAQSFTIKEFKANLSDLSASTQPRTDAEGQVCGLVKVQTKIAGMEFGKDVIGNVENKTNEYWIYLPKGTKEFIIIRPDYLPMTIKTSDYGIDAIESKNTYTLMLKENNLNPEKCGVTIHIKPREALVKIDDITLRTNPSGDYKVLLPKGEHLCRIDAQGYRSDIKTITTGKGVQDFNVELESLMAIVNIVSQTNSAEIFVDGESIGIGGWKGKMIPDKHVVEARQKGFVSATSNVTLAEKEERTIIIPKLTPIVGTLDVKSFPKGCKVYLDGEEKSPTPCELCDVVYGNHRLIIKLDSCGLLREKEFDIKIEDEARKTIQCELVTNSKWNNHVNATNWFKKGCSYDFSIFGGYSEEIHNRANENQEKAKEWYDKIVSIIDSLDASFFTRNMIIPELQEIENEDGVPTDISIINIPGEKMMEYYQGESEKVATIANKISEDLSNRFFTQKEENNSIPVQEGINNDEIFEVVEQNPVFPGGEKALMQYIQNNLNYPASAKANGIHGRVMVEFVINKDGSIANPKVLRSVAPILDKEALRLVTSMPKWNPGKQRGKIVRVRFTLPITFKLE